MIISRTDPNGPDPVEAVTRAKATDVALVDYSGELKKSALVIALQEAANQATNDSRREVYGTWQPF